MHYLDITRNIFINIAYVSNNLKILIPFNSLAELND
jgi:hypothetical protein